MTSTAGLRLTALAAAAGLLAAGCGSDDPGGCGVCGSVSVAPGPGVVWAAQGKNVFRLDRSTGRLLGTTSVLADRRGTDVQAIAADGTLGVVAAWTGGQALVGGDGSLVARHGRRPPGYAVAVVSGGSLTWLAAGRRAILLAPDASVLTRPRLPARVAAMAVDGRVVWAVGGRMRPSTQRGRSGTLVPAGPGYAVAVESATGRRLHRWATAPGPVGVTARPGVLWVSSPTGIDRLDPGTGRVLRHVKASESAIVLGAGHLWSLDLRGTLTRRDPATGRPEGPSPTRSDLQGLVTADANGVWVALNDPHRARAVVRIDPATMRMAWRTPIPVT